MKKKKQLVTYEEYKTKVLDNISDDDAKFLIAQKEKNIKKLSANQKRILERLAEDYY